MAGEVKLSTQSDRFSKFSSVFVSVRSPRVIVHPRVQKDETGARLVDPSSLTELTSATGVPKYRIFGSIRIKGAFSLGFCSKRNRMHQRCGAMFQASLKDGPLYALFKSGSRAFLPVAVR